MPISRRQSLRRESHEHQPFAAILLGADLSKETVAAEREAPRARRCRRAEEDWLLNLADAKFERAKYSYSTKWPAASNRRNAVALTLAIDGPFSWTVRCWPAASSKRDVI